MKTGQILASLLLLLSAVSGAAEVRLQLYKNGYGTGNPVCSAEHGRVYDNGYCTGNPCRSFKREGKVSRIYTNGYCTGNPSYSIRFDGPRAACYNNGYCTGNPKDFAQIVDRIDRTLFGLFSNA